MSTSVNAVKGQVVSDIFDVRDLADALLAGQASLLTKSLRDLDGAAAETVTIVEQGTSGYYKWSFTPTKSSASGYPYYLWIQEPAGTRELRTPWTIQVYDSISQLAGVTGPYLTSLVNVKEAGKIAGSADDAMLTNLIARVSAFIQAATGRTFIETARTEYFDGKGGEALPGLDFPIVSVASVHESWDVPRVWDATTVLTTEDFIFDAEAGVLLRPFGAWARERQSIRVVYTAGYASVPLDVEQLCIDLVLRKYRKRGSENIASRQLADGSVTYFSRREMTDDERAILSGYSRMSYV